MYHHVDVFYKPEVADWGGAGSGLGAVAHLRLRLG
jgi:hypothetical protein